MSDSGWVWNWVNLADNFWDWDRVEVCESLVMVAVCLKGNIQHP